MLSIDLVELSANVKGQTVTMQTADIHANGLRKILEYGFQRYFNDACGGDKTEEEIKEIIGKKMEGLKTGNIGTSRGRTSGLTLQTKMERKVAQDLLAKAGIIKGGGFAGWLKERNGDMWEEVFLALYGKKIGKGVGNMTQNDRDEAKVRMEKNMGAIMGKVRALVEAESQEEGLEL